MEKTTKEILVTTEKMQKNIKDIMILLEETKDQHIEIMRNMDEFINK